MRRIALALPLIAAACTTAPPPKIAAPAPVPVVTPPPPPAPPADWRDRPYTPGSWTYADRAASYGPAGRPVLAILSCDSALKRILLSVAGSLPSLTIRTSYGERTLPAQAGTDGRSTISFVVADPLFDQIAFSRGRFSIEGPDLPEMDIPAWAEPARVVEDCRG